MKKLIQYTVLCSFLALMACADFLELTPTYQENITIFYKSAEDFNVALMGCYDGLQNIYNTGQSGGIWLYSDLSSDIAEVQSTSGVKWAAFSNFTIFSDNPHLSDFWNSSYKTINRCNVILDKLPETEIAQTTKKQIEAEARFIRALVYFNLVRVFGDVPLVKKSVGITESYQYLREDKQLVYTSVIEDFSFAKDGLPATWTAGNFGRANSDAAIGMLGKVYLTLKDYSKARDMFKALINSKRYNLEVSYADVFSLTFPNKENIFEIHYASNSNGEGSRFFQVFMPQGSINGLGQGYCVPNSEFVDSFEDGDQRKRYMIVKDVPESIIPGTYGCYKYRDANAVVADGANNWIVLRYADVLLSYAEAENMLLYGNPDALEAYNAVRVRAGLVPKSFVKLSTQQSFDLAVETERKFELAFEGHRWFDLIRRDRALEVINNEFNHPSNVKINEKNLLFPIPLTVINSNRAITQNPGYN